MNEPYIDLLKKVLIDYHRMDMGEASPILPHGKKYMPSYWWPIVVERLFKPTNYVLHRKVPFDKRKRLNGLDWPVYADTMIGLKRMNNIEYCVKEVLKNGIEGDFIETGVWRGGACIFMAALLKVNAIYNRKVWVADSFEGLPKPDKKYEADKGSHFYKSKAVLGVSLEQVMHNFRKYGLLTDNVRFLKGWFKDTLPTAPIDKLSILRLDGDMYESTINALDNLYHKLSKGGFCIIDDYGVVKECKQAVMDYRNKWKIRDQIIDIDGSGVYWKKLN